MTGDSASAIYPQVEVVLKAEAGLNVSSHLEWLSAHEIAFVAVKPDRDLRTNDGAALFRMTLGEAPRQISEMTIHAYCFFPEERRLLFERTIKGDDLRELTFYDLDAERFVEADPSLRSQLRSCARGFGPFAAPPEVAAEAEARLETPSMTLGLLAAGESRSLALHPKTGGGQERRLALDWSSGGLISADAYAVTHNPQTLQTTLFPLLDYEQKQAIWKARSYLDVFALAPAGEAETIRIPWFPALEETSYSILANGRLALIATEWPLSSDRLAGRAGLWASVDGRVSPLFEGRISADSLTPGPDGRLAFLSPTDWDRRQGPVTDSLILVRLPTP